MNVDSLLLLGLSMLPQDDAWRREIRSACLDCHGKEDPKAGLNLEEALEVDVLRHVAAWEKVVRRLRARQMPPPGKAKPSEAAYGTMLAALEGRLDAATPDPGRPDTIRRLTRLEYQNAVRELLALEVDASQLLPADESSHGFDVATAGTLSATVLERYVAAAEKISRRALGRAGRRPGGDTFRVRPDVTQEDRLEGMPLGTRGGLRVPYVFPQDGAYEVRVRLMRDRDERVEGLHGAHELVVLLDRSRAAQFTVKPPKGGEEGHADVDAHLIARLQVGAGPRELAVAFLKKPAALLETLRQPYEARFNAHRHPRQAPAVFEVSIVGPYDAQGPGDTPSRRRILVSREPREILAPLLRRAFRRPVAEADLEPFLKLVRAESDLEEGLEAAVAAILSSSEFLFRVERDPAGLPPKTAYALSDLELATRLAFFLWSGPPDDALLAAAERGALDLEREARRMLADPRARSLAGSFAVQWLHLRNLEAVTPDARLFPDFDDNLRQAMRLETELFFEEIVREDRSVLALLSGGHSYLNERLAKHYGVPHVYGARFRRVERPGGLLRHASVLTVTSYATRTSPVLRGKWILETLLGTPPPPPPPDVPALEERISESLPIRERLKQHRNNPTCAACHRLIDPVGFALEHFDAVGRRRDAADAAGGFPDGSEVEGVEGVEAALLRRPEVFVGAVAEKLLTYALGRAVEPSDGPAIRKIVRGGGRFSDIVAGIVTSVPFRMRRTP
jgi:hypothetical protein